MTPNERDRLAAVEVEVQGLRREVERNRRERREADAAMMAELRTLTAALNRGRGALAALLAVAGLLGGLAVAAIKALFPGDAA